MSESQLKKTQGLEKLLEQALLHIGIYQSVVGDLPIDVVNDVVAALPKTAVYSTPLQFVAAVREVAAQLAEKVRHQAVVPVEAAHSPYSGSGNGGGTPQVSLDIVRNARASMPPPPPQSPLILVPGRK